ncbi:MAG TPA: GAF domain-containing protein [Solirubrobacteraceae bacterium]|nr:GAF domain-containing protein [Solirubrobacteraceae bacterium]
MRASSPALAVRPSAPRPSVPRPTPSSRPPRPTLRSVDLEVIAQVTEERRSSAPPPLPARAHKQVPTPRASHPEIVDHVFSTLRDLSFFETPVEAAAFCVCVAMKAIPSLAGIAMLRDEQLGGYIAVYARGPRAYAVVRTRVPEGDAALAAALARGGPCSVEYDDEHRPPERHASFGDPWTALVAPVQGEERCMGAIELVDPIDGKSLGDADRQALATVAQHLADFVRAHALDVGRAFAPEQVGLEE